MARPADNQPATVQDAVARIKQRLVHGDWSPGDRLPTRTQLQAEFGLSHMSMQRALNRLTREGFLVTHGPRGTFVAEHPPYMRDHGLLLFAAPHHGQQDSRFLTAMLQVAGELAEQPGLRFATYYGIGPNHDAEDLHRLKADLAEHRLAGLIMPQGVHNAVREHGLLEGLTLPRVAIVVDAVTAEAPSVSLDRRSFYRLGMQHVAKRGRQRVATLCPAHPHPRHSADDAVQAQAVQDAGLVCPRHWRIAAHEQMPEYIRRCVWLLMDQPPDQRPGALVLTDDHLEEDAIAALLEIGLLPGRDLELVSLANFPAPRKPVVPMTRIGFDLRTVLESCLTSLAQQRAGHTPQTLTIAPVFESGPTDDPAYPEPPA